MSFDLGNHMPIPYDAEPPYGFVEDGFRIAAWEPGNDDAPRMMVLRAWPEDVEGAGTADAEPIAEREIPMCYPNNFGIDVADMAALERATEELLVELRDGA